MQNTKIYNISNLINSSEFFNEIKGLSTNIIIFCDANINKIYGKKFLESFLNYQFKVQLIVFNPGEENKTREVKQALEDELLKRKIKKDHLLIALGGGVTTDLIGFIAATYLRGIKAIYVPTTLLAMVDAAIGAKVGVNTSYGKNLIGAFYCPDKVFIDQTFLKTLPSDELINGYVEMLKHGLINSNKHFQSVCLSYMQKKIPSIELILDSIQIKQKIIVLDALDQNIRKTLNFGHTFGHAIEVLSNFQIKHGYAVAIGIFMESYLSMKMQFLSSDDFHKIKTIFQMFTIKKKYTFIEWKNALKYDKKNSDNSIEYIALKAIGKVKVNLKNITHSLPDTLLLDVINWIQQADI
jgi:3-dehydroquinate synthase